MVVLGMVTLYACILPELAWATIRSRMRRTISCSSTVCERAHAKSARPAARILKHFIKRLEEFRAARLGARLYFIAAVPVEAIGEELLLRIHSLIPGDLLAGVRGHASHQR